MSTNWINVTTRANDWLQKQLKPPITTKNPLIQQHHSSSPMQPSRMLSSWTFLATSELYKRRKLTAIGQIPLPRLSADLLCTASRRKIESVSSTWQYGSTVKHTYRAWLRVVLCRVEQVEYGCRQDTTQQDMSSWSRSNAIWAYLCLHNHCRHNGNKATYATYFDKRQPRRVEGWVFTSISLWTR